MLEEPDERMLTATWNFEDVQAYEAERDRALRKLRPLYKGKARTVKQRNKSYLINLSVKFHNDRVLRHRAKRNLVRFVVHAMGDEIRKEIDKEILGSLNSLISLLDSTPYNIETEQQQ